MALPRTLHRNGTRGSLPHSLCLCLGSLAASGPAKVVGLESASEWIANWPTDFGGPAAVGEATEATATGKAPGIQAAIQNDFKTGQTRSPGRGRSTNNFATT